MTERVFAERIGEWIKASREKAGMSQKELAVAIGVSDAAISGWENRRSKISAYHDRKLRRLFARLEAAGCDTDAKEAVR